MASSEEELKSLLLEVGSMLGKPPISVKELLALLDRVEVYLSRVEQSPSKTIQNALSPTLKALVGDELLRHTDVDVKVSVASCISEITRITAPEVAYDDDQMREIFQLIVSSFESLADTSSQSYIKRTSILETVAKVRSCVVMLDLECDGLILEMFRHFIKAIRDYHPENVFTCMESIMTRVIKECDEISSDLLFCILDSVKKDNKEVVRTARKLMEKVIETCGDKLKPYIEIEVRTKGLLLADYDEVVSLVCNEASAETIVQSEQTNTNASVVELQIDENKLAQPAADTIQTAEETPAAAVNSIERLPAKGCSDFVTSNGNAGVEADTLSGSSTLQDPKSSNADKASETVPAGLPAAVSNPDGPGVEADTKASETIIANPRTEDGDMDAERVDEGESTEPKAEKIMKKRGRKAKAKKKTSEPKLDAKQLGKSSNKEMCPSPQQISSNKTAEHSSPKPSETDDVPSKGIVGESEEKLNGCSESKNVVSSSENHSLMDEKMTISAVGDLEEGTTIPAVDATRVKAIVSAVDAPMDETSALNDVNLEDTTILASDAAQEVAAPTIDKQMVEMESSAGKSPKQSGVPSEDTHEVEDGPSKTKDSIKKRGRGKGKATLQKLAAQAGKSPTIDKQMVEMESSAGKSLKQSGVPSEDTHEVEDGPSKAKDSIKKRGRGKGKATLQKLAAQAAAENNNKEATTSQKPALKPVKDEEELKETPKTSSKRKRIEENNNERKDYGVELVGSEIRVWWPADKRYYKGVIESFDSVKKKHKVLYADGEVEHLVLQKQRWEVINPDEHLDTEEESNQKTPDFASGKRQKAKEVNDGTPKKRLGRPPSSKSKSASNKPGRKPKDHAKSDSKSEDDSKAGAKAKINRSKEEGKSKVENAKRLGRPRSDVTKSTTGKSTADEPSGKSKVDEPKPTGKSTTADDGKSSGKPKGGDSRISIEGLSDGETSNVKQKDPKRKGIKSGSESGGIKSLKMRESKSTKPHPEKADLDPCEKAEESKEGAEEEEEESLAKAVGSLKRKARVLEKGNISGGKKRGKD